MERFFYFKSQNMQEPIKKNRQIKEAIVASLTQKIANSKSLVFADYRGLSANQISTLRSKIKNAGGELLIAKNTLLKLALASNHLSVTSDQLVGPMALILGFEDEITPIKEAAESAKTYNLPKFKFGFLGKELLDGADIDDLAILPSKDALKAKVVGLIASPISEMIYALRANLKNLVTVMSRISKEATS